MCGSPFHHPECGRGRDRFRPGLQGQEWVAQSVLRLVGRTCTDRPGRCHVSSQRPSINRTARKLHPVFGTGISHPRGHRATHRRRLDRAPTVVAPAPSSVEVRASRCTRPERAEKRHRAAVVLPWLPPTKHRGIEVVSTCLSNGNAKRPQHRAGVATREFFREG